MSANLYAILAAVLIAAAVLTGATRRAQEPTEPPRELSGDDLERLFERGRERIQEQAQDAAEQGDAAAQYNLGRMYTTGEGVPQDFAEAIAWYRQAAEQGHAPAQHNLGWMYATGKGVAQDNVEAHTWLNLAASRLLGEQRERTVTTRDAVAERMTPADLGEAQRRAREWHAAHLIEHAPLFAPGTPPRSPQEPRPAAGPYCAAPPPRTAALRERPRGPPARERLPNTARTSGPPFLTSRDLARVLPEVARDRAILDADG